jgi:hypothetical protein
MPRDISKRLAQLRTRRVGTDRLERIDAVAGAEVLRKSITEENWQKRAKSTQPYTQYALGAMQEVSPDYTRISIETAERVGKQLNQGLASRGVSVEFRLQGSVPLNVHIRGVSDVDLLTLDTNFCTYHRNGSRGLAGAYMATPRNSITVIAELRNHCERILRGKYPAATVDTSGSKAIAIYGGSLARPVDVVPSHWFDTTEYQDSAQEHDRAVTLLDKNVPKTIDNWPFRHIKRIQDQDLLAYSGLKKAIRLCKHVKNDAETEGKTISFSSFDIAAAMYYADLSILRQGFIFELTILAETQRHLDWLTMNEPEARKLKTPDGSRLIFDSSDKLAGLRTLSIELDELAKDVAKEQNAPTYSGDMPLPEVRKKLSSVYLADI